MLCFLEICLLVVTQFSQLDITLDRGYVTQMKSVPAIVFLAHNNLSGSEFLNLNYGDVISYDSDEYIVREIVFMQAIQPNNPAGDLIDMESGQRMTAKQTWFRVYSKGLVLQTCVQKDDEPSWGRLFILADKE